MKLAVVDRSNIVPADAARTLVDVCSRQLVRDVAPIWERWRPQVTLYERSEHVPQDEFQVVLFDDGESASALGFHGLSPENGRPYGRVFVRSVVDSGGTMFDGAKSVSSVLSHELIEMFIDPRVSDWTEVHFTRSGVRYNYVAKEVCDPVESDCYVIDLPDGRYATVSNFVTPEWFDTTATEAGTRFDWMWILAGPLELSRAGYMVAREEMYGRTNTIFGDVRAPEWRRETKFNVAARSWKRMRA